MRDIYINWSHRRPTHIFNSIYYQAQSLPIANIFQASCVLCCLLKYLEKHPLYLPSNIMLYSTHHAIHGVGRTHVSCPRWHNRGYTLVVWLNRHDRKRWLALRQWHLAAADDTGDVHDAPNARFDITNVFSENQWVDSTRPHIGQSYSRHSYILFSIRNLHSKTLIGYYFCLLINMTIHYSFIP